MNHLGFATFGVDYREYDRLREILEECRFAGLGPELSIYTKTSRYPDFMEELARKREMFAPYYVTFHGPYSEVEATSPPGSQARQVMVEAYRQAFRCCRDFSARTIVMHTNQKVHLTGDDGGLRENCISVIRELGEMAGELGGGVRLLVENVGIPKKDNVLFPMEEFIRMFDELPEDIGCLIDVGHAFINRWDMEEVIRRLKGRIASYHLHNNDGDRDSHRMLFEDHLYYGREDWRRLFAVMEEYTPGADWILEYSPKNPITPKAIAGEIREILRLAEMRPGQHAVG